ncbi:MAG: hypothetical protein H6573_35350 [Lewinellaceae bacterium]|nr:hypothetical protein [Phaeodactylibacter sp.]MCB0566915.1 hypothetical protein [Phaeodactylibacter sp.]MCB9352722.1 hypothetical protein [Lewinellaceae bacterium]
MIQSTSTSGNTVLAGGLLLLALLAGTLLYFSGPPVGQAPPPTVQASNPVIDHEVTASDLTVDWAAGGGDFDPRDKCPPDFFGNGFVLLCKKLDNGVYARFFYHKGKKRLYRIDKEVISGKARIGLHWVESTKSSSRYRIADPAFKGGKAVKVPNAKGGRDTKVFHYGQAVSKRRSQFHRELFRETHIRPEQCPEWWDIFNFMP